MTAYQNIRPDEKGITVAGNIYKYIEIEDESGFKEHISLCSSGSAFSKEKLDSIKEIFSDIIANTIPDKETQNLENYTWSVDFETSPTLCSSIKVAKIGNIILSNACESAAKTLSDENSPHAINPKFYTKYQKNTLDGAFKSLLNALEEIGSFSSDTAPHPNAEEDAPSRALSLSSSNSTSSSSNDYAASLSAPARKASLSQEKENEPEIFGEASILPIDSPSCSSVSSSSSSSSGSRFVPFMAQSVSPMPPLSLFSSTLPSLSHTLAPELSAPMHLMSSLPTITAASPASRPSAAKPPKIVSVPEVHAVAVEKLQPCAMSKVIGADKCPHEAMVLRTQGNKSGISEFMRIVGYKGQNLTLHFCSEKCNRAFEEIVNKAHKSAVSATPALATSTSAPGSTATLTLPESSSSSSSSSSSLFMAQSISPMPSLRPFSSPLSTDALSASYSLSTSSNMPEATSTSRASRRAQNPANRRKFRIRLRHDNPSLNNKAPSFE